MTPLVVPLVELIQDNKWRMGVTNLSIYGFENITVMDVKWVFRVSGCLSIFPIRCRMNKTNLKFTLDVDNLEASGRYEMNGRLIFLDLEGSGFCFVKFGKKKIGSNQSQWFEISVKGSYTFDGTLTPYENNGKNYLRFGQPRVDYRVKRVHMQFENLLHKQFANTGKKSPRTNRVSAGLISGINPSKILDDNWDMVMEDIDVPFKEVISTIVLDIVSSIMDDIPEKNVFLTMWFILFIVCLINPFQLKPVVWSSKYKQIKIQSTSLISRGGLHFYQTET